MAMKEATPRRGNCYGVKRSTRDQTIVSDLERGYTWAGIALSASFVLMGVLGAMFGW